jgi:hypothetical protein
VQHPAPSGVQRPQTRFCNPYKPPSAKACRNWRRSARRKPEHGARTFSPRAICRRNRYSHAGSKATPSDTRGLTGLALAYTHASFLCRPSCHPTTRRHCPFLYSALKSTSTRFPLQSTCRIPKPALCAKPPVTVPRRDTRNKPIVASARRAHHCLHGASRLHQIHSRLGLHLLNPSLSLQHHPSSPPTTQRPRCPCRPTREPAGPMCPSTLQI